MPSPWSCVATRPATARVRLGPRSSTTLDFTLTFDVLLVVCVLRPSTKRPLMGLAVPQPPGNRSRLALHAPPVCPSVVSPAGVHSRRPRRMTPSSSAPRCYLRRLVPSSWALTTSTACSTDRPAGLLHPASDPGVRLVASWLTDPHMLTGVSTSSPCPPPFPRRTHPAKASPPDPVGRCHHLPIPPCRYREGPFPHSSTDVAACAFVEGCPCLDRLRGLARAWSPLSSTAGCPTADARSFLGFLFPLQGLSSAAARHAPRSAPTPGYG